MPVPPSPAQPVSDIPFLDVLDPAFDFHSPEVIAARERNWYADSPLGLLVLRYAEARDVLRDRRLTVNGRRYLEQSGVFGGALYDWFVPMINHQDGESHRRLRALVNRAFTPRTIEELRPYIRAVAERLAGELAAAGTSDFIEGFADPLPIAVLCELLGVPAEDYDVFRGWTSDIGLVFGLAQGGDIPARAENAAAGLTSYVDTLIAAKEKKPAEDLISALVAARRDGDRVSRDELANLVVTLIFGAHDTTRHQLTNAMVTFAECPGQWRLLAERPELAEPAVEEVMRWRPSVTIVQRYAAESLDFQGVHIEPDTGFVVCIPVAQRDPRVFSGGDTFDILATREAPPLQFGGGPHHCLGSALARAELNEALPALARRLGPPQIAGPVAWRPPLGIHGPDQLPLRFH